VAFHTEGAIINPFMCSQSICDPGLADEKIKTIGKPQASGRNCTEGEKCDYAEAMAGVALIAIVDLSEAVFLIVVTIGAGPVAAAGVLELTAPIWIPANLVGAYMIFDSGVVRDFNRTAWGLR
jgi:hypothetical protein